MKKHVSNYVEKVIDVVVKKIRLGDVVIDREKYEHNRALRRREAIMTKRATLTETVRRTEIVNEAEQAAEQSVRLRQQLEESQAIREEAIRQRRAKRQEEKRRHREALRRAKKLVSKNLAKKPLHVRMKEKFHQKYVLPEIQRNQSKLQKIKAAKSPMDMNKILRHDKEYKQKLSRHLRAAKEQARNVVRERNQKLKEYYRGRAHQRTSEEDSMIRRVRQREKHVQDMIKRKRRYASLVREMFAPKTDPNLAGEIQGKIQELKEREKFLQAARSKSKDMRSKGWRIEDEDLRREERRRVRAKRKKQEKEEEERRRRARSAPNYLAEAIKLGSKKKKKPKKTLPDIGDLESKVLKLERRVRRKTRALRRSRDDMEAIDQAAETSDLVLQLAREKMKLYERMQQNSR